jgi:hypothetical protein
MTEGSEKGIRLSPAYLSIIVLLIIQTIVFAYGYGQLCSQVAFARELISAYQANQVIILAKLDDQSMRLTKIETRVEALVKQD